MNFTMKLFAGLCVACQLIVVNGAAFEQILPENPKYPGKCYYKDKNILVPVGQTVKPTGECAIYKCSPHKSGYSFSGESCGVIGYDKNKCHLTQDLRKPYPNCCPKLVCRKN